MARQSGADPSFRVARPGLVRPWRDAAGRSDLLTALVSLQLALKRPEADAEPFGRMRSVAADLLEGSQDRLPLDVVHRRRAGAARIGASAGATVRPASAPGRRPVARR